jgi:hypothetical protein
MSMIYYIFRLNIIFDYISKIIYYVFF